MIGALLFVTALLQGAAPQAPIAETLPAPGTVQVVSSVYNLSQFQSELKRAIGLIEKGSESEGLAVLDKLAALSSDVRRVRNLGDDERADHTQLFVERAKGYLSAGNDKVEDSLRELLRVNPLFKGTLAPRLRTLLDALIARETGTLEISSPVIGAGLRVNGALVGLTGELKTEVRLLKGEWEVRAQKAGFSKDGVIRVVVVPTTTKEIKDLAPRQVIPPLVLLSERDDIAITIAGSSDTFKFARLAALRAQLSAAASQELDKKIAASGLDANAVAGFVIPDAAIEVGKNVNLAFGGECLVKLERTISITEDMRKANETAPLMWLGNDNIVRPQQDVGMLRVSSTPSGAQVFVNNQPVGSTPLDLTRCSGPYTVRVRHPRVGSFATTTTVRQGQTVPVEVQLKPGIAFLGAVDATQSPSRSAPDLNSQIVQTATATLKTFRAADQLQVPNEIRRWSPQLAVDLVTALDKNDATQIAQLLGVATANFEAPLMVTSVRRADTVEILFLWNEHAGVDRVRWSGQPAELTTVFERVDAPVDGADLVYQNDIGIRFADTALPGAPTPILVVRVDDPATSPLKVGDVIEAVGGMPMTAQGLSELVRRSKPGDKIALRISWGAAAQTKEVTVARKPRRAPVFDPGLQGNVLIAKLSAAALAPPPNADPQLFTFSLAAAYMRFGDYKAASDLLTTLGNVPAGAGVGRGPALYLKARALEAQGQRDQALTALKDAAGFGDQVFADDGAGVGTMAERHAASLSKTP